MAAANGHVEIIKIILPLLKPEIINAQNESGNTALRTKIRERFFCINRG